MEGESMKGFVSVLAVAACLVLPRTSSAQNTVKLLDPVNIAQSPFWQVPIDEAVDYASKQLYLDCHVGAAATILGPYPNFGLIVDDFIRVQSPDNTIRNYCADNRCFTLPDGADPLAYAGQPADVIYGPVDPVDVSSALVPGLGLYTFSLMDYAYSYASSALSLSTTCAIKDKICHYDNGKKAYKTLTLGAAAIPAMLNTHPQDYLGACTDGK
jgi:hypothetical protein